MTYAAALPVGAHAEAMPCVRIGLKAPRPLLHERIRLRVDRMWAAGLVDEVHGLINDPKNWRPVTVDFPEKPVP